jgi:hypothetical protein
MTDQRKGLDGSGAYTVHVGAPLGAEWEDWFDGARIRTREDGTCTLSVRVRDQAVLFGILLRIRDLGVPLLGLYPGRDFRAGADPAPQQRG